MTRTREAGPRRVNTPAQPPRRNWRALCLGVLGALLPSALCACAHAPRPGETLARRGDEIMVAGQLVHTGAKVVLWTDPGGYDAYRVQRRFVPPEEAGWAASAASLSSPNRHDVRPLESFDAAAHERLRAGGWTPQELASVVDQFVIHYDVCGTSRRCFRVLHDLRGLSVHFMIDLDGTIYQTLDVKERAWHATIANGRSVGVEIAHIGAYPTTESTVLDEWYAADPDGTRVTLPPSVAPSFAGAPGFVPRPRRAERISGEIHGRTLVQHDFTPEQYEAVARLAAALSAALPAIALDAPRGPDGAVLMRALTPEEFNRFSGVLGHWHVQENKVDPGPAFDWEWVLGTARRLRALQGARPDRK